MNQVNKIVSIIIRDKTVNKPVIKNILSGLREKHGEIFCDRIKSGIFNEEYVLMLKLEKQHHSIVLKELMNSGVNVLRTNEEISKLIKVLSQYEQKDNKMILEEETVNPIEFNKNEIIEGLNSYVIIGDYKNILPYCKSENYDQEIRDTALTLLPSAVVIAIEEQYHKGKESSNSTNAFEELLSIATDKELLALEQIDPLNRAGTAAIELCIMHKNLFPKLIDLIKSLTLQDEINIRASIVFWNHIRGVEKKYKSELHLAAKNINLHNLGEKFSRVTEKFSKQEIKGYNSFVESISEKQSIML